MQQWIHIVGVVVSVFLAMGIGALVRRLGWLTAEADASLFKLVIRLLMPCLILQAVMGNQSLRALENLALPPVVGYGLCALGIGMAALIARLGPGLTGLATPEQRRTFAVCVGIFNYGFIPIPLVQGLFDRSTLGVLFVHNVGVDLAIWTIGLLVLTGSLGRGWWKRIINPPSVAIVAAVGFNLLDVRPETLGPVWRTIELLADAAIPTSLLLVGATIADELRPDENLYTAGRTTRIISWAVGLRLLILPAIFLLVAHYVAATVELQRVVVIESGQATAVFPIVMARHYGGSPGVAVRVVLASGLLSLLTMPLWIGGGLSLLGLW